MGMHGIKLTTATIQRSYHPSDLMNESSEISPLRMSSVAAESSLGRSAQPAGVAMAAVTARCPAP